MNSRRLLLALVCVLTGSHGLAMEAARAADPAPDLERLLAATDAAKAQFRPVTETDLRRARAQLNDAIGRLRDRLALDGPNGQAWARYLQLDELTEALGWTEIAPDALEAIYRRFGAGHYGLNRVWFADARDALQRYIQVARAMQTPELEEAYVQYIDTLASYLRGYVEKPGTEQAVQIGGALGWLESMGQAPGVVAAVREELARPNLFATVSSRVVAAGVEEPVDETEPVRDVILGTDLHGIGHSLGDVSVRLVPNENHAVFDITYLGVTRTRNTGYNGPVVVFSRGTTGIGARKRLWVNESGLHSHPARANATTRSHILDIQPQRGGRMVERIAWRRAMEQKHLAEAIASQRAAARAGRRMDSRAAGLLAEANHDFEHRFRRPMAERRVFPSRLQFASGEDAVQVEWLQAGPDQLAAAGGPPPVAEHADLSVQVHQSAINNAAKTMLTGLTLNDDEFRMAAKELLGRIPEQLEPVPGEEPFAISFDRDRPVEVGFADGGFRVTLRGRRFFQGDQPHPGMNVSARYRIVHDDSGFRAVREGDLEVVPPGLAEDQRLGTRHQIIRTLLIRRFDPVFEKEFRLEPLAPAGRWEQLGAMPVVQFEANDGWLTVGWRLPEGS